MVQTTFAATLTAKAEIYDELVNRYTKAVEECEKQYRTFANSTEGWDRDYAYSKYLEESANIEVIGNILKFLNPDCNDFIHPSWIVVEGIIERVSQE